MRPLNKTNVEDKRTRRFLKQVGRKASFELEHLREIPKTPSEMDYFYNVIDAVFVQNEPERVIDPDGEDRIVIGAYCMLVPEELIYAAGAVPVRLCAGSFDASQMAEDSIPRDGCPLVKSSMGFSVQRGLRVFDRCDVVIVPTTCDCKRKFAEEVSRVKKVWILEVPHVKDANFSRRIWVEQIYALKKQLETYVAGRRKKQKITSRRLGTAIQRTARAQAEIRRLLNIRSAPAPVIWGRQAMAAINAYAYAPSDQWAEALKHLNDKLMSDIKEGKSVCPENTPRILIAGSPSIFPNMKIPALVEEMGGIVVYDESCAGDRYLYDPVGSTENNLRDQMAAIASRYMAPCICPSFAPNDDRLIMIKRIAADYAVDGVLYHVLKGCIIYDFEVLRVEKTLKELGIPLLRIETDYNPEDVEQLRTRIEAFIEMMKSAKKKQGEVKK